MKNKIIVGASIVSLLIPAGAVLAKDITVDTNATGKVDPRSKSELNVSLEAHGSADIERDESGRPMPTLYGEQGDDKGKKPRWDEDKDGDRVETSASGKSNDRLETAGPKDGWPDEQGSSSERRKDGDRRQDDEHASSSKGWGKGGIVGFFRSFFGFDDDASVRNIRAAINASSTVATTTGGSASSTEKKPQGLGFWGRVFRFFSFGGDSNK